MTESELRHPVMNAGRRLAPVLLIAVISGGFLALVSIYASSLRDPRFLDGWSLAAGIIIEVAYHVALKRGRISPTTAKRWRSLHIFLGYVLICAFLSHTNGALPHSTFGWSLFAAYALVTLSGLFGVYLAWSRRTRRTFDEALTLERIPVLRADLAEKARALALSQASRSVDIGLPDLPHEEWVANLYNAHLARFFEQRGLLRWSPGGSRRDVTRIHDEIESLSSFVDAGTQEKLRQLRSLVDEKQNLERAHVFLGLARAWHYIHVPVTYALIVLVLVHALAAYSFSSGTW